jgi:transglutaminase-like putative cysteine protease
MKKFLIFGAMLLMVLILIIVWQLKPSDDILPPISSPQSISVKEPIKEIISSQYEIPRTVRYHFTLKNTGNRLLKQAEFWAYAPVKQTATQKVIHIKASHAHDILTDRLGNQVLHFVFANMPPYASKVVSVTTELMLAKEVNPIQENNQQWFLGEEPFIEISHPKIQAVAKRLKTKENSRTSRKIFNWVARHIQYAGYIRENRGALYALNKKSGDCTEYMYLFTALARVNEIPARGIGGYIYSDDALLKSEDYHNWAEFYLDGKWQLADPQNKVFMDKQSNYIAMRIISEQSNLAKSHRFWYSGEGLSVRMN